MTAIRAVRNRRNRQTGTDEMVRKLAYVAGAVVVLGAATFWILTTPQKVSQTVLMRWNRAIRSRANRFSGRAAAPPATRPRCNRRCAQGSGGRARTGFGFRDVHRAQYLPVRAGIGTWTIHDFANAMLKGVGKQNEHLYPSFPTHPIPECSRRTWPISSPS